MKNVFKNTTLIFYYIIQLIIFWLCFFTYTSTIEIFPWYEPLTMGAFMAIMLLIPIQGLVSIFIWMFRKRLLENKNINIISNINIIILGVTFIIPWFKEPLFYPMAKIFAVIECLLIIWFIIKIIKSLMKINK